MRDLKTVIVIIVMLGLIATFVHCGKCDPQIRSQSQEQQPSRTIRITTHHTLQQSVGTGYYAMEAEAGYVWLVLECHFENNGTRYFMHEPYEFYVLVDNIRYEGTWSDLEQGASVYVREGEERTISLGFEVPVNVEELNYTFGLYQRNPYADPIEWIDGRYFEN
jgi:hypothetical protein